MDRRSWIAAAVGSWPLWAQAHHGWSSFDQGRPLYLEGRAARVAWRNPHAELELELDRSLALPADLAAWPLPSQVVPVDGVSLLRATRLPTRTDRRWQVELAPLNRLQAWGVPQIREGDRLAVVGFTFAEEKGEAVLRAEFLFVGARAYGLRSSPA